MKLHHIGIASNDIKRSIRFHEALFNFHPITEIVDDPTHKVSVVLLSDPRTNEVPIELVSPSSQESPVSSFLQRGTHLYHVCYTVNDIEYMLKKARKEHSIVVSGPAPSKLYGGRKIAFIYTPDKYLIEFLEEESPQQM